MCVRALCQAQVQEGRLKPLESGRGERKEEEALVEEEVEEERLYEGESQSSVLQYPIVESTSHRILIEYRGAV